MDTIKYDDAVDVSEEIRKRKTVLPAMVLSVVLCLLACAVWVFVFKARRDESLKKAETPLVLSEPIVPSDYELSVENALSV